jgi:hypothetical protein
MIARKLKKLRKPEYGTLVPNAAITRTTTLKRRIASATRSIGEVLRNHTKKRREEVGAKFRVPGGQYIVASESWSRETADVASAADPTSFKFGVLSRCDPATTLIAGNRQEKMSATAVSHERKALLLCNALTQLEHFRLARDGGDCRLIKQAPHAGHSGDASKELFRAATR